MPSAPPVPMLVADLSDFPWVIVLMLVFSFVQWIASKLKGSPNPPDPVPDEVFADGDFRPVPPRTAASVPPPIPAAPRTLDDLRQLLEAMREAREAAAKPVPPPIPPAPAPSQRQPQAQPRPAPVMPPVVVVPSTVPLAPPPARHTPQPNKRATRSGGRGLKITPQSIRDAVILKEILDPPPGLREDGRW